MIVVAQIIPALLVLVGVAITALAGVLNEARKARGERRKVSGSIETSEAQTLWDAAEQLRHDMRDQLDACKHDMTALRLEIASWQEQAEKWRDRVAAMEKEIDRLSERLRVEELRK